MKFTYGAYTLADSADLSMVPRDFTLAGKQLSVDESRPQGAATIALYARGNRAIDFSVTVDYGFGSYEETAEFAALKWNLLADQADVELTFGSSTIGVADAVLDDWELVPGSLAEVACLIRWKFRGAKFTSIASSSAVTSILTTQTLSPSAAGNSTVTLLSGHRVSRPLITPAIGDGTYTHVIILPATSRFAGDTIEARVEMPASANPTIEFRNATSGGTLLKSIPGLAGAVNYLAEFVFTGSAWRLQSFRSE